MSEELSSGIVHLDFAHGVFLVPLVWHSHYHVTVSSWRARDRSTLTKGDVVGKEKADCFSRNGHLMTLTVLKLLLRRWVPGCAPQRQVFKIVPLDNCHAGRWTGAPDPDMISVDIIHPSFQLSPFIHALHSYHFCNTRLIWERAHGRAIGLAHTIAAKVLFQA